jgi:cytochrome c oxidase assembly protein subunit 15
MRAFIRLGYVTVLWTYVVIFLGGLVRVSGAGLGCPDWPKCFGRWIPPTRIEQLPVDMNPELFNFTLAWIEYINRLAGMLLGMLIVATAILAWRHFSRVRGVLIPSVLAALLVAFEGWQGGQVIATELEPLVVSLHMGIAFLIVSLLILAITRAYLIVQQEQIWGDSPSRALKIALASVGVVTLLQVALGSRVRGGVEMATEKFPLWSADQWLGMVSKYAEIHYLLGAALVIGTWLVVPRVLKLNAGRSPLVAQAARGMLILVLAQVVIGAVLVVFDLPAMMQLFHLWVSALFAGMALALYATFMKPLGA